MPKISDLKNIRAELANIGDEKNVLEEWGEHFELLDLPSADAVLEGADDVLGMLDSLETVPSADQRSPQPFDEALTNVDVDKAAAGEKQTASPEVPENLLSDLDLPDFDMPPAAEDIPINDALFDTTDFNAEDTAPIESESAPADISGSPSEKQIADEGISFDLDDEGIQNLDTLTAGLEPTSSEADNQSGDEIKNAETDFDPSAFTSTIPGTVDAEEKTAVGAASDTNSGITMDTNAAGTSFDTSTPNDTATTFTADDTDMTIPIDLDDMEAADTTGADANDLSFTDEDFVPSNDNTRDSAKDNTAVNETAEINLEDFGVDFDDGNLHLDDSHTDNFLQRTAGAPDTVTKETSDAVDDGADKNADLEDVYQPVESLDDVDIPEIDEKTGFGKKGSEAGTLAPPEKFQNFATDSQAPVFTAAKTTSSAEETTDGIPLAISEKDFQKFLAALAHMPLNLRKEIQHYIVYENDLEVNKMELVHLIVNGASLHKVVKYMENTLQKSIKIPKGFDKKSFEELERERKTLKYKLRHKVLPVVSIAAIFTVLICSIAVIGWHFIYKPIMAEKYYRDGVYYIENAENVTALEKFDKAGTYWKKKAWYFKYADRFRSKKQYAAASSIYERLLFDFNHDVKGGIAYAEMLMTDMGDYQKAETVLRRQVLDYHPQSKEAMAALGTVYLEWGLEDSSKLDEAKAVFTNLLKKAPSNIAYNLGLMKYYIRTDDLEHVLPYKDYVIERANKISAADMSELSGYLLTCRYEGSSKVTENLKTQIDDLRQLLETAYKADPADPTASYNLGKFFLYSYKPAEAEYYLKQAIDLYGTAHLPLGLFFKRLDAMRLYGELLLQQQQQLEAETVFSNALALYKSADRVSPLPPNKAVGKLFEDYGDIKYFIVQDYPSARESYTSALNELTDTASIRYKLGAINYRMNNYNEAVTQFGVAYTKKSHDANLLFALGNALFKRADYYVAQAYYERLLEQLDAEKLRRGIMLPQIRENDGQFVEMYMKTTNNLAVTLNRLAVQTGNSEMNARSFSLFAESTRSWDALTRNPETLIRVKNQQAPAYVNVHYMTAVNKDFVPEIYIDIPKTLEHDKVLSQAE